MSKIKYFLSNKIFHRDKLKSVEIFKIEPLFIKLKFWCSCVPFPRPELGIDHASDVPFTPTNLLLVVGHEHFLNFQIIYVWIKIIKTKWRKKFRLKIKSRQSKLQISAMTHYSIMYQPAPWLSNSCCNPTNL